MPAPQSVQYPALKGPPHDQSWSATADGEPSSDAQDRGIIPKATRSLGAVPNFDPSSRSKPFVQPLQRLNAMDRRRAEEEHGSLVFQQDKGQSSNVPEFGRGLPTRKHLRPVINQGLGQQQHPQALEDSYELLSFAPRDRHSLMTDPDSVHTRANSSSLQAVRPLPLPILRRADEPTPYPLRKRNHADEFGGPTQYLPENSPADTEYRMTPIPIVPTNLNTTEQSEILNELDTRLSSCAFHFMAAHNFPFPLDTGRGIVYKASDRSWTEWAYVLKRLATKRRVPAKFVYDEQIKNMTTAIENANHVRQPPQSLDPMQKDDWQLLQYISAAVQVAKILKDGGTMNELVTLYELTERKILQRKGYYHQIGF